MALAKSPNLVHQNLVIGAVGAITTGHVAQGVLDKGQADVAIIGRQFLKNPGTVWAIAEELGVEVTLPHQIAWGFKGRALKGKAHKDEKSKV